jgi:putative addiction module component (TIGR02574 family)
MYADKDDRRMLRMTHDSPESPIDPEAEELWAIEAERRWREIESGAVETIPWEDVRARLFGQG